MSASVRLAIVLIFAATTALAEDLTVRVASAVPPTDLTDLQKKQLDATAAALRADNNELTQKHWNDFSIKYFVTREKSAHLDTLVDFVLRNGALPKDPIAPQRSVDIDKAKAKIAAFDKARTVATNYVNRLKQLAALNQPAMVKKLVLKYDSAGVAIVIEAAEARMSVAEMEAEIKKWEEKLNSIGDDAQLANVELQEMLQKQQQTLQMLSNISKMLYDTALAVIRKIGG